MTDFRISEDGGIHASFEFPEDFVGFQGHFEDNKILPGVCQVQCVINMFEKWKKKRAMLREIIMAKFLSPVLPKETLMCACRLIDHPGDDFILKASFSKEGKKVADVKLRLSCAEEKHEA
jgi:3-hydroxyacyl-[acyl-carrier-protein] dehydratase